MPGAHVDPLLVPGEQVGQHCREPARVQHVSHVAVAGAVPAAAAAVSKGNDAACVVRVREAGLERDVARRDGDLAVHSEDPTHLHLP